METVTIEEILEDGMAIVEADKYLSIIIAWDGEEGFHIYREVAINEYESLDILWDTAQNNSKSLAWAKSKAYTYKKLLEKELLA